MNSKYNLNYKLVIEDLYGDEVVLSSYDIDGANFRDKMNSLFIQASITRQIAEMNQRLNLRIYNLQEDTRLRIKKSRTNTNIYRKIEVYAGYGSYVSLIFKGCIMTALSFKESTDIITEITALSGGYQSVNGDVNISYTAGYANSNIINNLIAQAPQLEIGYINKDLIFYPKNDRGYTINGNVLEELRDKAKKIGARVFVDNERIYIFSEKEVRTSSHLKIEDASGLITVKEYDIYLEINMLFEPLANLNNKITIKSSIFKEYNGDWQLFGIQHNLSIAKIGGNANATTTLKVLAIDGKPLEIKK